MRNNRLMVYGSSYDRGLEHLLKLWPEIIKAVPDAQLHIFYGWHLFESFYKDNPERMSWMNKMNNLMSQPGITHLGRISHEAVKKEMENAGIWAYPTHFGEISCITAMKAQAYGAIPVVINYAALQETVQHGVKVDGDIFDPETRDEYLAKLIDLLKNDEKQAEIREKMMAWAADKFAWSKVAAQWDKEFRSDKSLERKVAELLDDNQALKAWDLVKDTDHPIKDRVWLLVRHAFDDKLYKEYYSKDLVENPIDESYATSAEKVYPRFDWLLQKLSKQDVKTLVDLGCADGYLALTTASRGIKSVGVNLYKPSVDLANERAKKLNLDATFICEDIRDHNGKYDAVVMFEVLEHMPDPQAAVDHLMTLVNDEGSVYVSTPRTDHVGVEQHKAEDHGSWDDGKPAGHLRLFTEREFKSFFDKYKIVDFTVDLERCMLIEVKKK